MLADVTAPGTRHATTALRRLLDLLARALTQGAGERVTRDAFDPTLIDQHLLVNFRAVDDRGRPLADAPQPLTPLLARKLCSRGSWLTDGVHRVREHATLAGQGRVRVWLPLRQPARSTRSTSA